MDFICFVRLQCSKFKNNIIIFNDFTLILLDDHVRFIKKIRLTRAIHSHTGVATSLMNVARRVTFPLVSESKLTMKTQQTVHFSSLLSFNRLKWLISWSLPSKVRLLWQCRSVGGARGLFTVSNVEMTKSLCKL